jgi:hypothetical protein
MREERFGMVRQFDFEQMRTIAGISSQTRQLSKVPKYCIL